MRLVKMPRLGQDMSEGVLVEWLKSPGDRVEEGELLAVIETDKAEVAFESPTGGYLVAILMEPRASAATGAPIAWIADAPSAQPPSLDSPPSEPIAAGAAPAARAAGGPPSRPPTRESSRKPVSPLARRRAKELGVDISGVEGTGPRGRVTEDDVVRAHEAAQAGAPESRPLPRMRRAIARSMTRSAAIPQFRLVREVVIEMSDHAADGPKATYTDLLLWAAAKALAERPSVNASWIDGDPPSVRVHPAVNLGFAVAVDDGLVVPVIPDAASLSLAQTSAQRRRLEQAARRGRLRPENLEGGTFTVSNLGAAGIDEFTALINPPEAGILAVGAVKPRPVVVKGMLVAAPTVRLTLTGDHRVFDGMEGAKFLAALVAHLGPPARTGTDRPAMEGTR